MPASPAISGPTHPESERRSRNSGPATLGEPGQLHTATDNHMKDNTYIHM